VICWRHGLADEALLELALGDAVKREVGRGVICRWRPMYRWDKKARPQHLTFTKHFIFNRHKELLDNLQSMGPFEFEPKLAIPKKKIGTAMKSNYSLVERRSFD
jgi:hypothetical protein